MLFPAILILAIAVPAQADLLRITDNHGAMVASCEQECEINVPGPVGDLADNREELFFVADAEAPQYFRTYLHWWGTDGADSYHITFTEFPDHSLLCRVVEGCGWRSDRTLTTELDFFSPVARPGLQSYEVTVMFAPEPGTLLLLGLPVAITLRRMARLRRHGLVNAGSISAA